MILFYLQFESSAGKIEIGGGTNSHYNCTDIDGLGAAKKEFTVINYAGENGQETLASRRTARTITLAVDVAGGQEYLARLNRIFSFPGTLRMQFGNKQRKIACYANDVSSAERHGVYSSVVIQLTCDDPDFLGFAPKSSPVYSREDLIRDEFTLPAEPGGLVFTRRTDEVDVINDGDYPAYPTFTVYGVRAIDGTPPENPYFILTNQTTGQAVQVNYQVAVGETVTMDIANRKITSDQNGNIINYLDDSSRLSDFWLALGENRVGVLSNYTTVQIETACGFSNRYAEAVFSI